MAILKVLQYPDPILQQICKPVTAFDGQLQSLIENMLDTMYAEDGMGIAANQIGADCRIFIMDESPREGRNPIIFINPELTFQSDEQVIDTEGCLSFRGVAVTVMRAREVAIKALDRNGQEFVCEREGYSAKCLQHEFDHLNGITFFDHLSQLKRKMAEKKLSKYKKANM